MQSLLQNSTVSTTFKKCKAYSLQETNSLSNISSSNTMEASHKSFDKSKQSSIFSNYFSQSAFKKESLLTVPNMISSSRLVLSPLFFVISSPAYKLGLFSCLALSDVADGYIARKYANESSEIGALLDPLADKVLIICAIAPMMLSNTMPSLLGASIILKDLIMLYISFNLVRTYKNFDEISEKLKSKTIGKVNSTLIYSYLFLSMTNQCLSSQYNLSNFEILCAMSNLTALYEYSRLLEMEIKKSSPNFVKKLYSFLYK
ncbi:MAG: hypothetical protein MHPSP_002055 [Paramarteilia canceri]